MKFLALILLAASLSFAQDTPKVVDTQTPAVSAQPAPVAPKPDTIAVVRKRVKALSAQQKQQLNVIKAQAKLMIEQIKAQQVTDKGNREVAIAQAKAK